MNSRILLPRMGLSVGLSSMALAGFFCLGARAQSVPHLSITQPGGMPGLPVMTGIQPATNGAVVTWDGPPGYYQLYQRAGLKGTNWTPIGTLNSSRTTSVPTSSSNGFFRVLGPPPHYAGSSACFECHSPVANVQIHTEHAAAFTNSLFVAQGGQTNASCLPCHTVGYGLPSGFVSSGRTPNLAAVQCENCHGPAANHAANPDDILMRPRVELAAEVCGGCHTGVSQPTFDEWQTTGHAQVVEDMNPSNRIDSCGRCHSGSARLSMLQGKPLPQGDANVPITCAVCHDPHQTNSNPAQLRNPLSSTNDYFITTSTPLTNQYNPDINLCAQCHNHRGAVWTSTSRAPHHSPQYNIMLGTVGELASGLPPNQPAYHARGIAKQCAGCHVQVQDFVSQGEPRATGHNLRVESFNLCLQCHPLPEDLVQFTQESISYQVQQVKSALDLWATTKAPPALATNYGTRSWEYTTPGDLSPGGPGPSSTEQALIPVNIQKARFDLYLVYNDGSFGVHNGPFCVTLLQTALNWVEAELGP
jgi:hypothetical protein